MALDLGVRCRRGHWGRLACDDIVAPAPITLQNLTDTTTAVVSFGVMLKREGRRWLDDSADINSITYASRRPHPQRARSLSTRSRLQGHAPAEPRYSTAKPYTSDT